MRRLPHRSPLKAMIIALMASTCASPALAEPLDRADRVEALDILARRLDHYVMAERKPDILARLAADREVLLALEDDEAFRAAVNRALLGASRDKHLQLWREQPRSADEALSAPPSPDQMAEVEARDRFGLAEVRLLEGDVAYVKLNRFSGHPDVAGAIDAVLAEISGARALILDLRGNGGGGEAALNRLMGHLVPAPIELATLYHRQCAPPPADRPDACVQVRERAVQRRWSDTVARPTFPSQPIFVLTSNATFSAAEELAYDLRAEGRATIIGETTGGGANPSGMMDAGPHFSVVMPLAEARHPRTGGNWEGVGVAPDVAVREDAALDVAVSLAAAGDKSARVSPRASPVR
ncbi:S41 family peptidase [Brevundimonas sp.]|uniref:S41 family peptidase n=1 Tax=Brevundimonas sp. TaxID=1871086 RepID=UPI0035B158B2